MRSEGLGISKLNGLIPKKTEFNNELCEKQMAAFSELANGCKSRSFHRPSQAGQQLSWLQEMPSNSLCFLRSVGCVEVTNRKMCVNLVAELGNVTL